MSLIPQRFKGIAKLWNGHYRKGGRPSTTSTSSSSAPTGPTDRTARTSFDEEEEQGKAAEVSEHSDIVSQMESPSALLSTCSQDGSERGNNDFDDFIKKDPLAKTGGGRGGVPVPVSVPIPTSLKGQTTTNMRSLLQKSSSLRLPQHVDKFEPVDALCDFQPLDPRQRRRRRRNSIHTDTRPMEHHYQSSPHRGHEQTNTCYSSLPQEQSIHTVPFADSKQKRRNSLSGPIAMAATSNSPRTKRNSPRRLSPRTSPRQRNSPRGNNNISSKQKSPRNTSNLRSQFHRGYSCTHMTAAAKMSTAPLTTLPPAPNLGTDQAPKHPRQQRRNSLSGPSTHMTMNTTIASSTSRRMRRNSVSATGRSPRVSPRNSPCVRGARPAFNRGFSCSHVGAEQPQSLITTLPQAPDLSRASFHSNQGGDSNKNAKAPKSSSSSSSPRASPRNSPPVRGARPDFTRGFSCSHMGQAASQPTSFPQAPNLLQTQYKQQDYSIRTAPSRVVAAVAAPTHPRQRRRNSMSGPMVMPSIDTATIPATSVPPLADVAPTHPRQQRRNSTGAATTSWMDAPPVQPRRAVNYTNAATQPSQHSTYGFSSSQLPPCTPPNPRFGLTRGLSAQNLATKDSPPSGDTRESSSSPPKVPAIPSTPPVARTAMPRNSSAVSTSSCSPKSSAARSVSSTSSPRSITMVPSTPPRPLYGRAYSVNNMPPTSPTQERSPTGTNSPVQAISLSDQVEEDGASNSSPTPSPKQYHRRSHRRNSCGTYCPPSPGSDNMLQYSNHTAPDMVTKSDQAPTQPRRRRRNSINGPLASPAHNSYMFQDELPRSIPEDEAPSFSSEMLTNGNGTSPSSSFPMTSSPPSAADGRPPPPPHWGLSRRGSGRNLMESVNQVVLPLDSTSRFSAGSFDVGPSHPRQGNRQSRRFSLSGPTPPMTPRTPMTPLTPASTMASTISSHTQRSARPGLYRRASCGSFTIRSLSPHIELVSPLSFYEEKLAVQDPGRFASGCDAAPPGPPQRPSRSKASVAGSIAASSSADTCSLNISRRSLRPCLSRGSLDSDEGKGKPVSASTAAAAAAIRTSRRRLFTRGASCSALEYSSRQTDAMMNGVSRQLPIASSSSAMRLAYDRGENSERENLRGSMVSAFSATTENAVASVKNSPAPAPQRMLPRGSSSSALRLAQQSDSPKGSTDIPPRRPNSKTKPRRSRRASCSAAVDVPPSPGQALLDLPFFSPGPGI